jgi:hypothetical protein
MREAFTLTLVLFLLMYILGSTTLILFKIPVKSAFSLAFSLAFPLTLIGYLTLNTAPIPWILQENVKFITPTSERWCWIKWFCKFNCYAMC